MDLKGKGELGETKARNTPPINTIGIKYFNSMNGNSNAIEPYKICIICFLYSCIVWFKGVKR